MTKRVLNVGHCVPDRRAITAFIEGCFDAEVTSAADWDGVQEKLQSDSYDLVLVNRMLDIDHSQGLQLIDQLKAAPQWADIPVMMITNFDEHQQAAMKAGAVLGFGKQSLGHNDTIKILKPYLE